VSYSREYQQKTGQPVSTFGGHAYDGLMILVQAMQRAKSTDKAQVRHEIEKTKGYIGTGGIVNMTPTNHVGLNLSAFRMLEIKHGDWTLVPGGTAMNMASIVNHAKFAAVIMGVLAIAGCAKFFAEAERDATHGLDPGQGAARACYPMTSRIVSFAPSTKWKVRKLCPRRPPVALPAMLRNSLSIKLTRSCAMDLSFTQFKLAAKP
jgi:hypothetical protein